MTPQWKIDTLRIGQVLRLASPKSSTPDLVDDFINFYAATALPGGTLVTLDSGINRIRSVSTPDGDRPPAILIASSPHKIGSQETPWQDHFEVDSGFIRFYGDNRSPAVDPREKPGNAALIRAFERHSSPDLEERRQATPVIFFRRVPRLGKRKGFVEFQGFGIVRGVELITQFSERAGGAFSNYAFDFLVMSMKEEHEEFRWSWINRRRDPAASNSSCLDLAPKSWKRWVEGGQATHERVRRRVSKLLVEPRQEQLPPPGSAAAKTLKGIYDYYSGRNARFEALAAKVAEQVIGGKGSDYRFGGLTRASGDGGIDFIGRLDVGSGFDGAYLGPAKLIVLGQAKCQAPERPTHGRDIARTVARLRRGWLGVYVTTSFFSTQTQREVVEDRYPIVLINGKRVGEEVHKMTVQAGGIPLKKLLDEIEEEHDHLSILNDPEDLLTS
ncbi:MAG TPA: restriction endonuclease [Solirubrobacterales bacterium]|nr:restriction endonuclease [Solirubrobacterales bacterium]